MIRTPPRGSALAGLAFLFLGLPTIASAGSVSSVGLPVDLESVGSGNILTLLTLQATPTESGSVTWNGSADVRTGNATAGSFTRSVAELRNIGIEGHSFGLVISGNESASGKSVTVPKFTMRFFGADGSKLFDAVFTAQSGKSSIPGFGSSDQTGWLYRVWLSDSESDLFYASDANRVGVLIDPTSPIGQTSGGAETLALLQLDIVCGPGGGGDQTPEPASVLTWLLASAGVWTVRNGRRRRLPTES